MKTMFTAEEMYKMYEVDEPAMIEHRSGRKATNRRDRRRSTALAKHRLQEKAVYADDEIRPNGKIVNSGFRSYGKGKKAWTRKVRHERFEEERDIPAIDTFEMVDILTGELVDYPSFRASNDVLYHVGWRGRNNWRDLIEFDFGDHPVMVKIGQDEKLGEILWEAKRQIEWHEELERLEIRRAELMAEVHELDREIRCHIARR